MRSKTKSPETLPNSSELTGSVCVQWRRSGGKLRPYYYRFWREYGRLRKQYVRLADVESVRAACVANRRLRKEWQAEIASARKLYRSFVESLKSEALGL
jgi:hypothetical protein